MKIIGHKGGGSTVPENSRTGLEYALSLGLEAVELDIWPTADQRFVLFHDADVNRLTGQSGRTMHLTSSQLQALEIDSPPSTAFPDERILLLEEALDMLAGKTELFLEIKRTRHELEKYTWLEERLCEILRACNAEEWTTVISFDHRSLANLHQVSPDAKIGMLYAGEWITLEHEIQALNPTAMLPHWAQTTSKLIEKAHSKGITVYPWVVNDYSWMKEFSRIGADGIVTDTPETFVQTPERTSGATSKRRSEGTYG